MTISLTAVARHLNFIRETEGPNRGAWVEWLQRFCYGRPGDSWCADFVSFVVEIASHGTPPVVRSGSAQVILADAQKKGYIITSPRPDDLFFYLNSAGLAHHVGIVTGTNPLVGIAGNTSEDGVSVNGTGVFEHTLTVTAIAFARLP